MNSNTLKIEIDDTFAQVSYKRGHCNFSKTISVDTLVNSLVSQYGLKSPLLPPGCRFYEKKGESHIIYLEIPPIPRYIKYTNKSDKIIFEGIVPFPWSILKFSAVPSANGGFNVQDGFIFALKRPLMSEQDLVFCFPAANVHSNHAICWGSTFRSSGSGFFKSLGETGRLVDLYFSSDFNTDISPRINKYERYEDMLREIKDLKKFPDELLVPVSGKNFEAVITGRT